MKYANLMLRGTVSTAAMAVVSLMAAPAFAQSATTNPTTTSQPASTAPSADIAQQPSASGTPSQPQSVEGAKPSDASAIVITGFRASFARAVNLKQHSNQVLDAITSE